MSYYPTENIDGLTTQQQQQILYDNLDANDYKIVNLANGTANQDAINKQQLDAAILGIYPIAEISDGGVPETKVNTNDSAQQITFTAGGSEVMTMKNNGFIIREDVNLQSNNIHTSRVPTSANDLTNKTYVDAGDSALQSQIDSNDAEILVLQNQTLDQVPVAIDVVDFNDQRTKNHNMLQFDDDNYQTANNSISIRKTNDAVNNINFLDFHLQGSGVPIFRLMGDNNWATPSNNKVGLVFNSDYLYFGSPSFGGADSYQNSINNLPTEYSFQTVYGGTQFNKTQILPTPQFVYNFPLKYSIAQANTDDRQLVDKGYVDSAIGGVSSDQIISADNTRVIVKDNDIYEFQDSASAVNMSIKKVNTFVGFPSPQAQEQIQFDTLTLPLTLRGTSSTDVAYIYYNNSGIARFGNDWIDFNRNIIQRENNSGYGFTDSAGDEVGRIRGNQNTENIEFHSIKTNNTICRVDNTNDYFLFTNHPRQYLSYSAPTTDLQYVPKKYVDDSIAAQSIISNGTSSVEIPVINDSIVNTVGGNAVVNINAASVEVLQQLDLSADIKLPLNTMDILNNSDVSMAQFTNTGHSFAKPLSMTLNQITNVGDPTSAKDAANKDYVDNAVSGLNANKIVNGTSQVTIPTINGAIECYATNTHVFDVASSGMTAYKNISMNGSNKITDLDDPTNTYDAANKNYVDSQIAAIPNGDTIESGDGTNYIACDNFSPNITIATNNTPVVTINDTSTAFVHDITTSVDQIVTTPSDQNYVTKKYADANYASGGSTPLFMTYTTYVGTVSTSTGYHYWGNLPASQYFYSNMIQGTAYNIIQGSASTSGLEFLVSGIYEISFNVGFILNNNLYVTLFKNGAAYNIRGWGSNSATNRTNDVVVHTIIPITAGDVITFQFTTTTMSYFFSFVIKQLD